MHYDLKEKVIIITGANSEVGKAACIQLARCNATVIMACRSSEIGAQALVDVRNESNSPRVDLMQVDLSSQESIRQFAREFLERYGELHVLIHNAANLDDSQKKLVLTADGIETVFATNHLGPFLLTHLLLDALKDCAPSRIVTVASKGLISYPLLDIEFDNLNGEQQFTPQHAYYHSKQAQVMFTFDLAERLRGKGVTVHCVRAGDTAIPGEQLARPLEEMLSTNEMKRGSSISLKQIAETYLWLSADLIGEQQTGGYWVAPGVAVTANKNAYNKETQKALWDISAELTGVHQHAVG
ncbi:MAG TPA: SDR family NAD(P)-dependent oxidoreductase [Anaerolineales bacterium]|nr:SDR family NAD(P)-dependent oxidoreductase [Anaerolineales bacterium]